MKTLREVVPLDEISKDRLTHYFYAAQKSITKARDDKRFAKKHGFEDGGSTQREIDRGKRIQDGTTLRSIARSGADEVRPKSNRRYQVIRKIYQKPRHVQGLKDRLADNRNGPHQGGWAVPD